LEEHPYPQAHWLRSALHAAATVNAQPLVARGLQGEAIAQELRRRRIEAIKHLKLKVDV
jgi:tRNA nucleotidyltransferase (CCA-adding enzyme)